MSVRHNAVITCNQCGKDETMAMSGSLYPSLNWGGVPGWMQVTYMNNSMFSMGTDTPEQARARIPDLCSWDCVMLYASEKAISYKEKKS